MSQLGLNDGTSIVKCDDGVEGSSCGVAGEDAVPPGPPRPGEILYGR